MAFDLDEDELKATRKINKADRNEIEVGEYVRTNNKGIKRIDRIDNNKTVNKYLYFTGIEDFEGKEYKIIKTTEIVKHSKQLIDLIEIGDYVNGEKIVEISAYKDWIDIHSEVLFERDIQTILTKESYMANCYKVGGEE
jgi:hypothetical protein|uniref:Uncharacterized protein n=1 Tax=Myoviridae sp. ctLq07 TaxID=2827681 RepID=A0A8S5TBH6_9CAUD|nr:MAG TPA: hypothetical protein [Myoviridae sp. ctLq07]